MRDAKPEDQRSRSRWIGDSRMSAIVPAAVVVAALLIPSIAENAGGAATYHVDCRAGNDDRSGSSPSEAWRSVDRANRARLLPGDRLLFRRGCRWGGPLTASWIGTAALPITIGAYGEGEPPRIQNAATNVNVLGSYLVFDSLHVRANETSINRACRNARVGSHTGFSLSDGAAFNVIRNSVVSELHRGIRVERGSHDNRIVNNVIRDNDLQSNADEPEGGMGIALSGDDNEVAFNVITGSNTCSPAHGWDGSAVEVYGGRRNRIHHNTAEENHNFTELGHARSADNVYAYNHVSATLATGHFLTTRGGGRWGPVIGTSVYHNSVYLTGAESRGVGCNDPCGPDILSLYNNILWVNGDAAEADAPFDEGHNIYWRSDGEPAVNYALSSTSLTADPRWGDPAAGDFRLADRSPAIDAGTAAAVSLGFDRDRDGTTVPQGAGVDIGAYERLAGQPPASEPASP